MYLDLKRCLHKQFIPLIIFLSLITILITNIIQSSYQHQEEYFTDLTSYRFMTSKIRSKAWDNSDFTDPSTAHTEGTALLDALDTITVYNEAYQQYQEHYANDYELFTTLKKAFEVDNITLTPDEEQDLAYAIEASKYVEDHQLDAQKKFAFATFLNNSNYFFHNLVVFIVSLFAIALYGEDFQLGTQKLNKIVPQSIRKIIFNKNSMAFFLSIFYCIILFIFFLLFALCKSESIRNE